jgi:hypothetical protein
MPKCPKGKVVNPKTGRCVKRDGALGKKILASKAKTPTRKVSVKKAKTPTRKVSVKTPTRKVSGMQKKFKFYVMLDDGDMDLSNKKSEMEREFKKQINVAKWKGQVGYIGLKSMTVRAVKAYPKYVEMEVTVRADKFEPEFTSLKQVITQDSSERAMLNGEPLRSMMRKPKY